MFIEMLRCVLVDVVLSVCLLFVWSMCKVCVVCKEFSFWFHHEKMSKIWCENPQKRTYRYILPLALNILVHFSDCRIHLQYRTHTGTTLLTLWCLHCIDHGPSTNSFDMVYHVEWTVWVHHSHPHVRVPSSQELLRVSKMLPKAIAMTWLNAISMCKKGEESQLT